MTSIWRKRRRGTNKRCFHLLSPVFRFLGLGGLLIFASYELTLIKGIEAIEDQNNLKMMYLTCLAIGSLFITAGALLAWISLDLGLLLWGSQKAKEGKFICWYHKFVFHEWKILVSEDGSSAKSDRS